MKLFTRLNYWPHDSKSGVLVSHVREFLFEVYNAYYHTKIFFSIAIILSNTQHMQTIYGAHRSCDVFANSIFFLKRYKIAESYVISGCALALTFFRALDFIRVTLLRMRVFRKICVLHQL